MSSRTALVVSLATLVSLPVVAAADPQIGPLALPILGAAPAPVPPAVVSRDDKGHVTIRATRLTEPLTLDGRLDERLYRDTEPIGEFVQQEPREGEPATEKTEVWVAYDEAAVYVGARLWESDPSKRVISDMRRDASNLYNNDHFAVLLDTFYNRHNGYVFSANAQGGMTDAQIANENANSDWNTIWETRAADFDGGWTIEFRIPFRSIRFKEDGRVWGINFRRMVRWKIESSFLAPLPASFGSGGLNRASGKKMESREERALFQVDYQTGDRAQARVTRTFEAITAPFTLAKGVRVPVGGYEFQQVQASYTFGTQRKVSGTATVRHGGFYDGTVSALSWRSRVEFSPQFYAEPTLSWNHVDVPWGRGNSNLVSSRFTYTLSPRMFVSGLVQYQGLTDSVSTNARLR